MADVLGRALAFWPHDHVEYTECSVGELLRRALERGLRPREVDAGEIAEMFRTYLEAARSIQYFDVDVSFASGRCTDGEFYTIDVEGEAVTLVRLGTGEVYLHVETSEEEALYKAR